MAEKVEGFPAADKEGETLFKSVCHVYQGSVGQGKSHGSSQIQGVEQ